MREEQKKAETAKEKIKALFYKEPWLVSVGTLKLLSDRYIVRVLVNDFSTEIKRLIPVKVDDVAVVVDEVNYGKLS